MSSANPPKAPCCFPVAQSPNEGRCSVNKANVAGVAWRAPPPIAPESHHAAGCNPPIPATPKPRGNTLPRFCRPTSKRGALSCPQDGSSHLPTPSPPLNRSAHRASATCARQYLPEELVALQIAGLLPAVLVLPPSRLDVAVRSSCRFGGERWPWLLRARTTTWFCSGQA